MSRITESRLQMADECRAYHTLCTQYNSDIKEPTNPELASEIRRLRAMMSRAQPYMVGVDGFCRGCDGPLINGEHRPDCPIGEIEREVAIYDEEKS